MKPSISIIIPIHNAEKWLNRCMDSLVAQSDTDFEVIAILDSCTDNSKQIALSYKNRLQSLRVYEVEYGRPGATRNIGIQRARTEQIAFLDCDDYYLPHAVAKMKADIYEAPVVTHKVLTQIEGTNIIGDRVFFDNSPWLLGNTYNVQWLRQNNILFNWLYYGYEDSDFHNQISESLCRENDNFTIRYNADDPFYIQVNNPKSITHNNAFLSKCTFDYSTLWRYVKSGVHTPNYIFLANSSFLGASKTICLLTAVQSISKGDFRRLVYDSRIVRDELPQCDYERFSHIWSIIDSNTSEERKQAERNWGEKYTREGYKLFRDFFAPNVFKGWNKPTATIINELKIFDK
ncbi:MAG: glycosyltransferase family 2 protein [Bacteroidales bacterium]|nr:glycosyltransferase family 2 protein [Salinivirgaceae bacterium]MBR4214021.1 glycosyltransferase family 2 protein [Bacteroidales bacterium]